MKIKVFANGPIAIDIEEEIAVEHAGASERKPGPVFLCRCGQSSTKPFCDGTHRKVGFEADGAELELPAGA